ncbi:MAG: hypothetical protein RR068_19815, partial [Hafnia sp.]
AWQASESASQQKLIELAVQLANAESKFRELTAQVEKANTAGWITWPGGDQPVTGDTVVDVIFADKDTDTDRASAFPGWVYFGDRGDIIAYRIHEESEEFAAQLRKGGAA